MKQFRKFSHLVFLTLFFIGTQKAFGESLFANSGDHPFDDGISIEFTSNRQLHPGLIYYEQLGAATLVNPNNMVNQESLMMSMILGITPQINLNPTYASGLMNKEVIHEGVNLAFLFGSNDARSYRGKLLFGYSSSSDNRRGGAYSTSTNRTDLTLSGSTISSVAENQSSDFAMFNEFKHAKIGYFQEFFPVSSNENPFLAGIGFRLGIEFLGDASKAMYARNSTTNTSITASGTTLNSTSASTLPGQITFNQYYATGVLGFSYSILFMKDHTLDVAMNYRQGYGEANYETQQLVQKNFGFTGLPTSGSTGGLSYPAVETKKTKIKNKIEGNSVEFVYHYRVSNYFKTGISLESRYTELKMDSAQPGDQGMKYIGLKPGISTRDTIIGIDFRLLY